MRKVELNKIFDKNIWICDNRVAALISEDAIKQIDYHGLQPVSRNARIFTNDDFVLKAFIKIGSKPKKQLKWKSLDWYPHQIEASFDVNSYSGTLHISIITQALLVWLSFTDNIQNKDLIKFEIVFNKKSITENVQGDRTYYLIDQSNDKLVYKINDKIVLNSWMKRKGAYKGDFMIPESWRRMVFKSNKVSGLAQYEDLKEEYKNDNLILYDENIFVIIGGNDFHKKEASDIITFQYEYNSRKPTINNCEPFCIAFGNDLAQVENMYSETLNKGLKLANKREKDYRTDYQNSPEILNSEKNLELFFRLFPSIVKSAEITDLKMFRACASSYYWLWAWDSMVTANALSYCGMSEDQKKVINFIGLNRNYDGAIPMQWSRRLEPMDSKRFGTLDFLFANLIMRQFAVFNDKSTIRQYYPQMVYSFDKIYESCNNRGFFESIGMYPDLPLKLGRSEKSFVSMEVGSAYSYSIIMNQFAAIMNDTITVKKTEKLIDLMQKNFLSYFYNDKNDFIVDSMNADYKINQTYALYSLLFIINSSSLSLIRPKLKEIGSFIENNLLHENGIALVPEWDKCRMNEDAMNSWYPYWDHLALKIFRRLNNRLAIKKWFKIASECFEYFGYCPEFVSLNNLSKDRKLKWDKHGTPWNLNCSAGWYQSIVESVFGFEEDIGGITYIPMSPLDKNMKLKNIVLKGVKCDIELSGSGEYVASFLINGNKLERCLKIPETFYLENKLKIGIHHSDKEPSLLFKELNGAIVKSVIYNKQNILIDIESFGFLEIIFYAGEKAELRIDNKIQKYLWNETEKTGNLSLFLRGCHKLSLNIIQSK